MLGLAVAVGIVVTLLTITHRSVAGSATPVEVTSAVGHDICADHVTIYAETNENMDRITATVQSDPHAHRLYTETKAEAFERFKETFKDQPTVLKGAREEALPASVAIVPVPGTDLHAWADQLRATTPTATRVDAFIRAEALAILPQNSRDAVAPCPASGEWNG